MFDSTLFPNKGVEDNTLVFGSVELVAGEKMLETAVVASEKTLGTAVVAEAGAKTLGTAVVAVAGEKTLETAVVAREKTLATDFVSAELGSFFEALSVSVNATFGAVASVFVVFPYVLSISSICFV